MSSFINFYKEIKPQIKDALESFNTNELNEEKNIINDSITVFKNLNTKGKMIRGSLIALGYYLNNTDLKRCLPLACAYEVFETAILVHDDIIDRDILRREQKTVSYYNKEKYKDYNDNEHFANSIALCIGDYALYKANNLIVKNYSKDENFQELFTTYNQTIIDTIRGEIIDVITPFEEKNGIFNGNLESTVFDIYELKTAYYTIAGPLKLGMILGGSNKQEIEDIQNYAVPLGIAFQIQDDLLGIFSNEEDLGKTVGGDIKEFKQTILYSYTKQTKYYEELLKEYGKDNYNIATVREIFKKSGAQKYAIDKANELYKKSFKALNNISWLDKDKKDILHDFITFLQTREK